MSSTYVLKLLIVVIGITGAKPDTFPILKHIHEPRDLEYVLIDLINVVSHNYEVTCMAVISDEVYLNVFSGSMFRRLASIPIVMIVVEDYEDLLSPNFVTLESLREARKEGCNVYIIMLANGLQAVRLLKFGDRHRILDTRAKYIMLHDFRLFRSDYHYLWRRVVNIIFLKYHKRNVNRPATKPWFELSTVPFPNPIKSVLVPRRMDIWKNKIFHYKKPLFNDKTYDFNGEVLNVVYLDHVPSVLVAKGSSGNKIGGVEIEILHTLAQKMNFEPKLYQSPNAEVHKWGQKQSNGSFSGLLGEMVQGAGDVALGNLQYTPYHLQLIDLSVPYTSQCWTFITPEALSDNSWKTLILPFKLSMWLAVLLVLLTTGTIFYGLARYYMNLQEFKKDYRINSIIKQGSEDAKPGLYLFGEIINSILYTYGMLLVVSLPRLPTGWSIRLLTGWYWLYCILLVVSYRASMTAILANPAPRVTIDTLQELAYSKVTCGGWGTETKKFFDESLDEYGQKIGAKFETVEDPLQAADKVAQGVYAYYDNSDFLKYLRVERKRNPMNLKQENTTNVGNVTVRRDDMEKNLHIMSDCVVNIPISVGFHKNSPLKTLADTYIRRVVEVGLAQKWLNDAMHPIQTLETNQDEIKALMNLKKLYGAFIALAIGYFISALCLCGEILHWKLIVKRDPNFDKYAMDLYYKHKNKKH